MGLSCCLAAVPSARWGVVVGLTVDPEAQRVTLTHPPCSSTLCSDTLNHFVSNASAVKTEKERLQPVKWSYIWWRIYRFTPHTCAAASSSSSVMALTVPLFVIVFLHFGDFWSDPLGLTAGVQTNTMHPDTHNHQITRNAPWPPSVVSVCYICCHWHRPSLKTIKSRHGKVFPASPQEAQTTVVHNPADGTKVSRYHGWLWFLLAALLLCPWCWLWKSGLSVIDFPEVLVVQHLATVAQIGLINKADQNQIKRTITWFFIFKNFLFHHDFMYYKSQKFHYVYIKGKLLS